MENGLFIIENKIVLIRYFNILKFQLADIKLIVTCSNVIMIF